MSSKWISLSIAALVSLTACEKFLKGPRESESDQAKKERVIIDTNDQTKCLKEVPRIFKLFVEDQGDAKNVDEALSCFQTSLKAFTSLTRGRTAEIYTAEELQHFLNRYILKENQISDGLMGEMMKVKAMFVGGSSDQLSKIEIDGIIRLLQEFKEPMSQLNGQMRLLTFRRAIPEVNSDLLKTAEDRLQNFGKFILDHTKMTSSRYELGQLKELLKELSSFMGEGGPLSTIAKWVPAAEATKIVFLGENANFRSKAEWGKGVEWVLLGYGTALRYYYQMKDLTFKSPEDWTLLISFADRVMNLISLSPELKNRKILDSQAIDRLIDEVWALQLFKTVITADLAKETYRKALMNMIEAQRGSAISVQGLTESHFRVLRHEYQVWKVIQAQINQIFKEKSQWSLAAFVARLKQVSPSDVVKAVPEKTLGTEDLTRAWVDFVRLASLTPPTVHDQNLLVQMYYNHKNLQAYFVGANNMNFIHSMSRLVHRGYAEKRSQSVLENRLSECGMVSFEEEFRAFGRALGFLDPRQKSPAKRTFMEGNFFTYHGNGDMWLTGTETYELLNLMMSGGRTNVNMIMKVLEANKCLKDDRDIFGEKIADRQCFLNVFHRQVRSLIPQLPWMVDMVATMNNDEFEIFWQNLSALVIDEFTAPDQIEYAGLRTLTTILAYIESLMMVYDTNGDRLLSESEIVAAVPRFATFIQREAGSTNFTEDIFLYLIYEGKKPAGAMDLMGFKLKRSTVGLDPVSKQKLVQVMSFLKNNSVATDENTCSE